MKAIGIGVLVLLSVTIPASAFIQAVDENLVLDITDPSCVMLRNEGDMMIAFSSYGIISEAGLLNPDGFGPPLMSLFNSPGIELLVANPCMVEPMIIATPFDLVEDRICGLWGMPAGLEVCLGDIGGTATVDDLSVFLGDTEGIVVPEPASMALLALGGMASLRKRR